MDREFIGVLQNFGASGSMYGSRIAVPVVTNTTVYVPAGAWIIECDANVTCKFTADSQSTFIAWVPVSSTQIVASDGFCVAFIGSATSGTGHRSQILNWQ